MRVTPRPNVDNEECPQCGNYKTMVTKDSWDTYLENGHIRCTDMIECYNCGLRFYVGWTEKPEINPK